MKTLLVLAQHPEFAEQIRAAVNPDHLRLVVRLDVAEAEPFLARGLIDACVLEVDPVQVQGLWAIEKFRARLPHCPMVVFTEDKPWPFEEEAYLQGVLHVLAKPVRPRLFNAILNRLWPTHAVVAPHVLPLVAAAPAGGPPTPISALAAPTVTAVRALEVLRDFSGVLSHSLRAEGLLRQFLIHLRQILGVNRAAIFLRGPVNPFQLADPSAPAQVPILRSACAIGLPHGLLEHFELSFDSGIGGFLFRQGRILRLDSPEAQADVELRKEFEILGAQVAIPILDHESLVGVATFDGRVTGEPLVNGELELIFHLFEQLGLAIKNIWLHDQLLANHDMLKDILRQLSSACVLVSRDLVVHHANNAALRLFCRSGRRASGLEFSELPPALGSKIYQVLQTGTALATFKHEAIAPDGGRSIYQVNIIPFHKPPSQLADSALMVVEDQTQIEQFKRLEIEAGQLRLIRQMAARMAHEIGNAMVPLATYQQLFDEKFRDAEFRASLNLAMAEGVKRVSRLVSQMRYLAREGTLEANTFPLIDLIEESFQEAGKHQHVKSARLKYEDSKIPILLKGDRTALRHAFSEVMLNALQANLTDASITISMQADPSTNNGLSTVRVEVRDNGLGFSQEALQKVPTPFFTTKTVGLGLGLSVCQKILHMHHGSLEIVPPANGPAGVVRIILPLDPPH